jgi:hypothetical protein
MRSTTPNILTAGIAAPEFSLHVTPDQKLSLRKLRGKPVILRFKTSLAVEPSLLICVFPFAENAAAAIVAEPRPRRVRREVRETWLLLPC